jgi:signal peptidase I
MRRKTHTIVNIASVLILLIAVVFVALFKITFISEQSMDPAFREGQATLVCKLCHNYEIGDIITFNTDIYGVCVKRIIGQPGDTVELKDGAIYKNGIRISPYTCSKDISVTYVLDNEEYFVIGDNYNASIDSRNYGPISQNDIIGKVILY